MNILKEKRKVITFVKKTEFEKDGWNTRYHTELNGQFVSNSLSYNKEEAEKFFNYFLECNGEIVKKEILREEML